MKQLVLALSLALVPALVHAEDVYRWTDSNGVVHYSNLARTAPASATVIDTPITLEVDRLPGASDDGALAMSGGMVSEGVMSDGIVMDSGIPEEYLHGYASHVPREWRPDAPRIYDDERLRFGCYTAGVLYFGGFAHPDDIAPELNCYPYLLGPEAWLNAAKAELAMRQSGISARDMMRLYAGDRAH